MVKISLIKIILLIIVLIFFVGFIFFGKDKYKPKPLEKQSQIQEETVQEKEEEIIRELTEEDKISIFAENFTTIYYSYTWGNFSNIESLYDKMTDEMENRERNRVEQMKKGIENQSQKYFTVRVEVINLKIIDYQENKKATLDIKLKLKDIDGAFVTDVDVPEIRPNTSALIDGNKNVYTGNIEDLVIMTVDKKIEIKLVKENDKWKVARVK